jgi:hypothetical protein
MALIGQFVRLDYGHVQGPFLEVSQVFVAQEAIWGKFYYFRGGINITKTC